MRRNRVTLVLGGGRSGKSRFAEAVAETACCDPAARVYVATAEPLDDEMRARIASHRENRGTRFVTVEEPLDLAGVFRRLPRGARVVLVDCLTVWLGNLMFHGPGQGGSHPEVAALLVALEDPPCEVVLVSNETGMGIIPGDADSRRFRDLAGRLNQDLARRADSVVLLVAGIPVPVKGELPPAGSEARP